MDVWKQGPAQKTVAIVTSVTSARESILRPLTITTIWRKSLTRAGTSQGPAATSLSVAAEDSSNTSMVIPVWALSRNNPTAEKLVHALHPKRYYIHWPRSEWWPRCWPLSSEAEVDYHEWKRHCRQKWEPFRSSCKRIQFCHSSESSIGLHKGLYTDEAYPHPYLWDS